MKFKLTFDEEKATELAAVIIDWVPIYDLKDYDTFLRTFYWVERTLWIKNHKSFCNDSFICDDKGILPINTANLVNNSGEHWSQYISKDLQVIKNPGRGSFSLNSMKRVFDVIYDISCHDTSINIKKSPEYKKFHTTNKEIDGREYLTALGLQESEIDEIMVYDWEGALLTGKTNKTFEEYFK